MRLTHSASVYGEIVEDDHIARPQRWRKNTLDVDFKCFLIHGAVDDAVASIRSCRSGDEGLRVPMPPRRMIDQPRP